MTSIEVVIDAVIKLFAGLGGVTIALILLWIFYPEKVEKWATLLHKLVAYVSETHERRYISKNIEYSVKEWKDKLGGESRTILPYDLKVKWVDIDNVEHDLDEGALVVKMRNHRNQAKNFAVAVKEYVPNSLIPTAKRYVQPFLFNSIAYVISKNLLSRNSSALSYFIKMTEDDIGAEQKPFILEVEQIDAPGYLTRILLPQYAKLSMLHPADPNPEVLDETLGFEKKVHQLVTKEPGEDVSPFYNGTYVHAAIVPIAKSEKLFLGGVTAHLHFIKESVKEGIDSFYIVSVGALKTYAKELSEKSLKACELQQIWEDEYTATFRKKKRKLYCIMLSKTS